MGGQDRSLVSLLTIEEDTMAREIAEELVKTKFLSEHRSYVWSDYSHRLIDFIMGGIYEDYDGKTDRPEIDGIVEAIFRFRGNELRPISELYFPYIFLLQLNGDMEDPDLAAYAPIVNYLNSEKGQAHMLGAMGAVGVPLPSHIWYLIGVDIAIKAVERGIIKPKWELDPVTNRREPAFNYAPATARVQPVEAR